MHGAWAHVSTLEMAVAKNRFSPYPHERLCRYYRPLSEYPTQAHESLITRKTKDIAKHGSREVKADAQAVIPQLHQLLRDRNDGSGLHISTGRGIHLKEVTEDALKRGLVRSAFDQVHLNFGKIPSAKWKKRVAYEYAFRKNGTYVLIDNDIYPALEVTDLNDEIFNGESQVRALLFENRYPGLGWKGLAKWSGISLPSTVAICRDWQDAAEYIAQLDTQ